MTQSRQLAAIMFTDIVGYTALMGKDSAKALELVRISKEIQKPLVEKHHGQWLKEMGDGALVKFSTALDAVNCAIDIQRTSRADFDGKLRIGIHSGDITIENDDVYGDGVNVASRLESIADPGGIYISESIEKAFQGQTDVQAKYLGEIKLKNVAYGVRTYAVQGVGLPVPEVKEDKELSGHFFAEVQRRGVVRVSISYLVVGMLLILLLNQVQDWGSSLPTWTVPALITLLSVGFPVALFLAWNYERSPSGFVKTTSEQSWQNPYTVSQRKPLTSNFIIAGMTLIIVVMYAYPQFLANSGASDEVIITDKSIAVLPFRNESPDPDNQYFANGMVEEILNYLQKISALEVKARTSVERYRNPSRDIKEIAKELEVAFLLEGSVRKFGDDIRITAQLIEAKTGNHLWSETYDGKYTDKIFEFQSEIAKKIAASLNVIIIPTEEERINEIPTENIAAYDLYIRANHERWTYLMTGENKHAKAAHDLFYEALQIDPNYVLAIVGKGQTFGAEGNSDSAFIYAERAIDTDPEFNRGYGLKGHLAGNPDLAIEYFLKAISLPPKDDFWLYYHAALGREYIWGKNDPIKGLPYLRKGLEMTGTQYLPLVYLYLGQYYLSIGDYERAEEYYSKSLGLEVSCNVIWNYSWLMQVQDKFQQALQFTDSICQQGQCGQACSRMLFGISLLLDEFEKAEQYFYQWQNAGPEDRFSDHIMNYGIGYVYSQLGKTEEADKAFTEEIKKLESEVDIDSRGTYLHLSRIYAFQGNRVEALKYLVEYAKLGFTWGWHDFLLIDPFFESLRDDPEFKAIVKQAQEEKAALRAQVREMEERKGELNL